MLKIRKIKEFHADIPLIFVALVWGATFLPMAGATATNGVFTILFWRFFISFLLMFVFVLKFKDIDFNSIKYGFILGLILFCGFSVQTFAFKFTFSSSVAFISGLNVVVVPFLMYIFFAQRLYTSAFIGILLGVVGLYLLSNAQLGVGLGESLSVICAFAWAMHIIFTNRFVKRCEIFMLITTQFAVMSVLSLSFAYIFDGGIVPNLDFAFYKAMVVSVVFATLFGFIMQHLMLYHTTPIKAALIFTLEPVSAGILGYFVGGEHLSGLQIFGAVAIMAGVLVSEIGSYLHNKI
ncbi:DMT family transporter [Campylobacter sp. faydin G-140]|uniref:DMT family transporter n=1 Tax=Campylobacter anatolicus TaxID=2829105 RepID=UPI001B92B47E|nr:DMT family transporter [Campylobacter anatolicus]MBR8466287.1 DMT family transporter [Campylobacter anatolicus]